MHNIRAHPFYFWYALYTQTPFLTVKHMNPPFYPFSDLFKPTLSKAWVAHYAIHMTSQSTSIIHPTPNTTVHMTSQSTSIIHPTPNTTIHMTRQSASIIHPTPDTTIYMTNQYHTSHSWHHYSYDKSIN